MMMNSRKFDFRTAYIDILIALLMGTVVIFMLTTLLIAPITKNNEGIKKNADYVITMEWPENIDCDLDLWIRDPQNNIISYATMESGLMYLERDDMGQRRSSYEVNDKSIVIDPDNKEYVTFRGTMPGEYVINVHVYSCKNPIADKSMPENSPINVPVKIEIVKINPSYIVVRHIEMTMDKVWQEKTAVRFVMDDHKNILRYKNDFVSIRPEKSKPQ